MLNVLLPSRTLRWRGSGIVSSSVSPLLSCSCLTQTCRRNHRPARTRVKRKPRRQKPMRTTTTSPKTRTRLRPRTRREPSRRMQAATRMIPRKPSRTISFATPRPRSFSTSSGYAQIIKPIVAQNEINELNAMAGGATVDNALVNRVVDAMVSKLTDHANIQALIELDSKTEPLGPGESGYPGGNQHAARADLHGPHQQEHGVHLAVQPGSAREADAVAQEPSDSPRPGDDHPGAGRRRRHDSDLRRSDQGTKPDRLGEALGARGNRQCDRGRRQAPGRLPGHHGQGRRRFPHEYG